MSRRRIPKVSMTPIAVASDGSVIVNASYMLDSDGPQEIVKKLGPSAELYIGVVLPPRLVPEVMDRLDDAVAEIVGGAGPKVISNKKRRTR